jgi:hypothetical protein
LNVRSEEYAEIKAPNDTKPRGQGKNGALSTASRRAKSPKGLSEKDLRFLFGHLFVLISEGLKGEEKSTSLK